MAEDKILYLCMPLASEGVHTHLAVCVAHVRACNGSLFNVTGGVFVLCLCAKGAASPCSVSQSDRKALCEEPDKNQYSLKELLHVMFTVIIEVLIFHPSVSYIELSIKV